MYARHVADPELAAGSKTPSLSCGVKDPELVVGGVSVRDRLKLARLGRACLPQAGKPKCKAMSQACPGLDPGDRNSIQGQVSGRVSRVG